MPPITSPEQFLAWQLCEELADLVADMTATGPAARDFDLRDQVRKSSGGPGPNIAEGFGRSTPREFAHYLRMAVSSLMETRTWLLRGGRRRYWSPDQFRRVISLCDAALDVTRKLLAAKNRQIDREEAEKQTRRARRQRRSR